jgi:hypothetical protein
MCGNDRRFSVRSERFNKPVQVLADWVEAMSCGKFGARLPGYQLHVIEVVARMSEWAVENSGCLSYRKCFDIVVAEDMKPTSVKPAEAVDEVTEPFSVALRLGFSKSIAEIKEDVCTFTIQMLQGARQRTND